MSLLLQYFPLLDPTTSRTDHNPKEPPPGGIQGESVFDPEILFRRPASPPPPDDDGMLAGRIRGPAGGADKWVGRSTLGPMSRAVGCHGSSNNVVGHIGSTKTSGALGTESLRETSLGKVVDFAPNIKNIRTQAPRRPFHFQGRTRWTTPDFELGLHDGPLHLIEVKPEKTAADPVFQMRVHAIRTECAQDGVVYAVLTETFIRQQPRYANICLLRRYRLSPITAFDWRLLIAALQHGRKRIEDLATVSGVALQTIYAALYRGHLAFDLHLPLSKASFVWTT